MVIPLLPRSIRVFAFQGSNLVLVRAIILPYESYALRLVIPLRTRVSCRVVYLEDILRAATFFLIIIACVVAHVGRLTSLRVLRKLAYPVVFVEIVC